MPLIVSRRKDRPGALTISGRITLPDGSRVRIRARAQSDRLKLAREEAAALETKILRNAWHGERRGARSFAEAVASYIKSAKRTEGDKDRLHRIMVALGDVTLAAVGQEAVDEVRAKILRTDASPATVLRGVISPIRAVLQHAHRRGWCDAPIFEVPKQPPGRPRFLLPGEAERLIATAAPHVRPLLIVLLSTGARMSEAIELDWRDVDLVGARVIFWRTKGGNRRVAVLTPRAVVALANLPEREGPVFRWQTPALKRSSAYVDRGRREGGQIRTAWHGALRRAGLDADLTPHDLRHTWATWHYAVHRDLLLLKVDGGWWSVTLVERYAHLMPQGQDVAIREFGHQAVTTLPKITVSA